ncbi:MAG: glycosyltransferase [Acidimicrobiaceae bacterium]|nr:glycosyltransferase [Acidimicrobiaceae bacterium]
MSRVSKALSWVLPADAKGNDWPSLSVASLSQFEPSIFVSVVIPYYEAPHALQLTLAALESQKYPKELFEVVIVDDGSRIPLQQPEKTALNVQVVHQEDRGFGLARARNTGVRAASGDIIVFLDCDMMPEANWLAEHSRWHHAASDVLTLGFRMHVDVAGINSSSILRRSGTLGDLLTADGRPSSRPEWIEFHMTRTDDLASDDDDLFRMVTGGNLGVSRFFFEWIGGYDETFTQWGAEDTEFGYRAFTQGALLVPVRSALCWHQGVGASPSESESQSLELQRAKISQLIAHHGFRSATPGRSFTVPQYVVNVRHSGTDYDSQLVTVEEILASTVHDLVVWVETPDSGGLFADSGVTSGVDPEFERFRRLLSGDPRVRFGVGEDAITAFPAAAFHVTIPAGTRVGGDSVAKLREELGLASRGAVKLNDGSIVEIVRARVLHKAARCEVDPRELCHTIWLDSQTVGITSLPKSSQRLQAASQKLQKTFKKRAKEWLENSLLEWVPKKPQRAFKKRAQQMISKINLAKGMLFWVFRAMRWKSLWSIRRIRRCMGIFWRVFKTKDIIYKQAAAGIRRILQEYRLSPNKFEYIASKHASVSEQLLLWARSIARKAVSASSAQYRLGAVIATAGSHSDAVLAASDNVICVDSVLQSSRKGNSRNSLQNVQALLADTAELVAGLQLESSVRVAVLSDLPPYLSVPAFDAERLNPKGWFFKHRRGALALGPRKYLPVPQRITRTAQFYPHMYLPKLCRRAHHVEDTAEYHEDIVQRCGLLVSLAATGTVVYITDDQPELCDYLGDELHSLMTDPNVVTADSHTREAFSVAMRRNALKRHSLKARTRQLFTGPGLLDPSFTVPSLPTVSVLLATRRPDRLAAAVEAVSAQTYPRIELVLALHGKGFNNAEVSDTLEKVSSPNKVVAVPESLPLGAVLNVATSQSSGTLITKFDDDDLYGPEHLWDLVLAYEYSDAMLVGKGAEYVYLAEADSTIQRFAGGGERFTHTIAGGAMMIARHHLDAFPGWQHIHKGVDRALINDALLVGGKIYRTHGMGYMLVRHGESHTWDIDDDYFLGLANEVRPGCDLKFAGIA